MSLDYDTSKATARPRTPFANSTESEPWFARWCADCAHDINEDCPLVLIALQGATPAEWIDDEPYALGRQYRCVQFRDREDRDPEPVPQPEPDQDGLFERPTRSVRLLRQPQHEESRA